MPGFEIFGDEERKEVQDVLETGVLFRYGFDAARGGHWKARTFEEELARRLGVEHCHLCSSGTAALGIALAACGVGAGDEVIVPPFTFVATVEAVLMAGAVPVFADVDETLCLDPDAVGAAIGSRTRAVIPVHMCGSMARIGELVALCKQRDVMLIEDAAQAVGASYKGKALGTFGNMGCFSFDSVKTITCGEGGAVVTNDRKLYDRSHQYADHGHDHVGSDRGAESHPILGTNYRISELNAAVGLAQLRKLDRILEIQRANKARLTEALSAYGEVSLRKIPDPDGDSATFLSFFLPDHARAVEVAAALARAGVSGCFHWFENNWHYLRNWDHFQNLQTPGKNYGELDLARSDAIMGRAISMAISLSWTRDDLDQRIARMAEVFRA